MWQLIAAAAAIEGYGAIQEGKAIAESYETRAQEEVLRIEAERTNAMRDVYDVNEQRLRVNAAVVAQSAASGALSGTGSAAMVAQTNTSRAALEVSRVNQDLARLEEGAALNIRSFQDAAETAKKMGFLNAVSAGVSGGSKIAGL